MKRTTLIQIIGAALALLFFYAALSKLFNFEQSKHEMFRQLFSRPIAAVLVWLVPLTELLVVSLLLFLKTRLTGLYASLILLTLFTLYIAIALSGIYGPIPCACGGILKQLGYWPHLAFNFFFIVLTILGIALETQWKPVHRWFNFLERKEETDLS